MKTIDIAEEVRLQIMRELEKNPELSQRQLADRLGVSVGKTNYCLKSLVQAGLIKVVNFARSKNKNGYLYILTPVGIKEKADLAIRFLERKKLQYDQLKEEIDALRKEVDGP